MYSTSASICSNMLKIALIIFGKSIVITIIAFTILSSSQINIMLRVQSVLISYGFYMTTVIISFMICIKCNETYQLSINRKNERIEQKHASYLQAATKRRLNAIKSSTKSSAKSSLNPTSLTRRTSKDVKHVRHTR